MANRYHRFAPETGEQFGLISSGPGLPFQRLDMTTGVWVDDPGLCRYFDGIAGDQLDVVKIDRAEAEHVATEHGGTL